MNWIQTYIDESIPEPITPEQEIQALNNEKKLSLFDAFVNRIPKAHVRAFLLVEDKSFPITQAAINLMYSEFRAVNLLCVNLAKGVEVEGYDEEGQPIYYDIPTTETALK